MILPPYAENDDVDYVIELGEDTKSLEEVELMLGITKEVKTSFQSKTHKLEDLRYIAWIRMRPSPVH